jgi:hypothetical protein
LIILLMLAAARTVAAREVVQGNDCVIGPNQTVEGDTFFLCQTLRIDGTLKGNLYGAAFSVEINGQVNGSVYALAGQMDIRGQLGRDLIFAGPVLRIHPSTVFDDPRSYLISATLSTHVYGAVRIPGSIVSVSYQLLLAGDVGREVSFWGSALTIDGSVSGDVDATVGDPQIGNASQLQTLLVPFRLDVELVPPGLVINEGGSIGGQLTYTSTSEGRILGQVAHEPIFHEIVDVPDFSQINELSDESNVTWITGYLSVVLREFLTLSIIGLIAAYFLPRPLQAPIQHLRHRPLNSLGAGILTFILSIGLWIVALLLIILLVLLLLALRLGDLVIIAVMVLGVLNIGAASGFYFVAIYISRIVVCLTAGRLLVRFALGDDGTPRMLYLNLLAGIALLSVLVFLPVVGGLLNGLALALGLGAIVLAVSQIRGISSRRAAPVQLPTAPEDARQIPPPIVTREPRGPGMDNLPEGFRWWDDN